MTLLERDEMMREEGRQEERARLETALKEINAEKEAALQQANAEKEAALEQARKERAEKEALLERLKLLEGS